MTATLHWGLRAYERLLILYPEDLRRDFGADMMEAFDEDLAAARGIGGAFRVWRSTLREVLQIAVPAWLEIPTVAVPLLSAAFVAASQSPLIVLTAHTQSLAPYPVLADAVMAVATESAVSAIVSFIAIYRWKRAGLITLRLG